MSDNKITNLPNKELYTVNDVKQQFTTDANFELYNNLKANVKCNLNLCEIHDSIYEHYCFNCKRAICEVCKASFHTNHNIIKKDIISMNETSVEAIFSDLENLIKATQSFSKPELLVNEAKLNIEKEFELLSERLNYLKNLRLLQVDNTFSSDKDAINLLLNIKNTKKQFNDFHSKYKEFLLGKKVTDDDSFIFLQLYEIQNVAKIASNKYIDIIKNLDVFYKDNDLNLNNKFENLLEEINNNIALQKKHLLNETKYKENVSDEETFKKDVSLDKKQTKNNLTTDKANEEKNKEIKNSNKKVAFIDKQSNNGSTTNISDNTTNRKKLELLEDIAKLSENLYAETCERLKDFDNNLQDFKDNVYTSFRKDNNLSEIEKIVKMFEEKTSKRINFSNANSMKFSNSSNKSGMLTRSKASIQTIKKEKDKEEEKKTKESERRKSIDKVLLGSVLENNAKKYKLNLTNEDNNSPDKFSITNPNTTKNIYSHKKNSKLAYQNLFSLEENEDEDNENIESINNYGSGSDNSQYSNEEDIVEVNIDKNLKNADKSIQKLNKMFKPKLKVNFSEKRKSNLNNANSSNIINNNIINNTKSNKNLSEEEKFKLNKKLVDLIKENKVLINTIKTKEDISLNINTIRKYFSFMTLEYVRKRNPLLSRGLSSHFLDLANEQDKKSAENIIKVVEGTNELHIYERKNRKISKIKVDFENMAINKTKSQYKANNNINITTYNPVSNNNVNNKNNNNNKVTKINYFHIGLRYIILQDKIYITGGKDSLGEKKHFLCYDLKSNILQRLPDMANARCYHAMQYNESLKSLIVVGGENNSTCELYDFYLNMWNSMPNINVPRANPSIYIDKVGTYAFLLCGQIGCINEMRFSDAIEYIDLVDMNMGWAKIDIKNKDNMSLSNNEIKIYNLQQDKLLIYGAKECRGTKSCFCIFNIKTLELHKVGDDLLNKMQKYSFFKNIK